MEKSFNYQILNFHEDLSIVVENSAKTFRPLVFKSGNLYDPEFGFRPLKAKKNQKSLCLAHQKIAKDLIAKAKDLWKAPAEKTETPSPAPSPAPATPATALDQLIAQSVAQLSVGNVLDHVKPALDKFIKETYGVLPKSFEVKTPTETKKVKGMVHGCFNDVLQMVAAGIPVFLTGPAGCGKNVICKQIAEALGLDFYFSNAVTQEFKLTGFIDANGNYHATQFFYAFRKGGIFMLDEMDASIPEVLVILNAAIANGYFDFPSLGRVEAHKDFRVIAAGNTIGTGADIEYSGRFQLDAASLDRFVIYEVGYDKEIETAIAGGDTTMISFIYDLRHAVKSADMKFVISYRAISRLAKMIDLFDVKKAISLSIIHGMAKDDLKMIVKHMTTSNKYTNALKELAV